MFLKRSYFSAEIVYFTPLEHYKAFGTYTTGKAKQVRKYFARANQNTKYLKGRKIDIRQSHKRNLVLNLNLN